MRVKTTAIPDLLVIEPKGFKDDRGFFYESFNQCRFREITGVSTTFVQDNHSRSFKNVLRGLHYQINKTQGKLVRVIAGEVFDVAVDIRKSSSTFGCWVGVTLSAENMRQVWLPQGFAHGFVVISESAEVIYKATDYYAPEYERCILWNDPAIGIEWPISTCPMLSGKDQMGKLLSEAEVFA
jgi:dTDP-4-dehydrorhamnose 3,5-epimerase